MKFGHICSLAHWVFGHELTGRDWKQQSNSWGSAGSADATLQQQSFGNHPNVALQCHIPAVCTSGGGPPSAGTAAPPGQRRRHLVLGPMHITQPNPPTKPDPTRRTHTALNQTAHSPHATVRLPTEEMADERCGGRRAPLRPPSLPPESPAGLLLSAGLELLRAVQEGRDVPQAGGVDVRLQVPDLLQRCAADECSTPQHSHTTAQHRAGGRTALDVLRSGR